MAKKTKKENIPRGVQLEFEDVDYWHKLPKNKFVTLDDGTKISHYHYMKKFMHEYYGKGFDRNDESKNIIKGQELKSEADRNNNNTNRDALLVSRKMGALNALFQVEKGTYEKEEEAWETVFKKETYNEALKVLAQQTCDELNIEYNKRSIKAVLRTYFRVARFVKKLKEDLKTRKELAKEGKNA